MEAHAHTHIYIYIYIYKHLHIHCSICKWWIHVCETSMINLGIPNLAAHEANRRCHLLSLPQLDLFLWNLGRWNIIGFTQTKTSFEPRLRCRCCRCSSQTHSQPFLLWPPPTEKRRPSELYEKTNRVQDGIVAADCPVQWNQVELPRAVPTTLADPTKFRVLWVGGVSKPREIILRGEKRIWKHLRKRILTFFSIPWFVTWQFFRDSKKSNNGNRHLHLKLKWMDAWTQLLERLTLVDSTWPREWLAKIDMGLQNDTSSSTFCH